MSNWGGARTPAAPAVVSGPGALSQRTDGGVMDPHDPTYGEGVSLANIKAAAPMAGTRNAPVAGSAPVGSAVTSLSAPTTQPTTPVTAGAAAGEGPGVDALHLPQTPADFRRADAATLSPGAFQALIARAQAADATASYKAWARQVLYT